MEALTVEAVTIIAAVSVTFIHKSYKQIKYIKHKRILKKKLIKSINENNKTNIRKYIIEFKDFDKKYTKNKLLKTLEHCIRTIDDLNHENVYSLIEDFNFIDMIYNSEKEELEMEMSNNLDDKLKQLEKKRKEILIRANQIKSQHHLKNNKMSKNKKKKGKLN
jgi:hypothetical protein